MASNPTTDRVPRLMTVRELEAEYGSRRAHAYALVGQGILPHTRAGRRVLFDREKIERFLDDGGAGFAGGWRKSATHR